MLYHQPTLVQNNIKRVIIGLIGISIVIVVHELGHFLCAQFFNVPTPVFSLGFGPALITFPIGNTLFQLSLLPIGGYVELNETILAAQAYIPKVAIMLAGIVFNFIFAAIIIWYFSLNKNSNHTSFADCLQYLKENNHNNTLIGPIGLINIIGKTLAINSHLFWLILALISLNVGLFNLLPLPFFDGGKILLCTIETLMNKPLSPQNLSLITMIFFMLFALLISAVSLNDIKKINQ